MLTTALASIRTNLERLSGGLQGALLSIAVLSSVGVQAAPPPTGTVIRNQADATYTLDSTTAEPTRNAVSNTVEALVTDVDPVAPVDSISLVPDRQVQSTRGSQVSFPHVLSNLGSSPVQVRLEYNNLTGDGFDLTELQLFRDLNGNGRFDVGEPGIAQGDILNLDVGESVALLLLGSVPAAVTSSVPMRAQVLATSLSGGSAQVTDTVTLDTVTPKPEPEPPALLPPSLTKSATPAKTIPGGQVEYRLDLFTGMGWSRKAVTVDGETRYLLLVRDPLPPNTQLVSAHNLHPGTEVLYQLEGMSADQFQSMPPVDLGGVRAVAFGVLYPQDNSQLSFSLQVRMSKSASGRIVNVGYVEGTNDKGSPSSIPSNPAVVTLPGPKPPSLEKNASPKESAPGGLVDYQLSLFTGGGTWNGSQVKVDGQVRNLILVADPLPASTHFVGIGNTAGGLVLYQLSGSPDEYQSTPPADLNRVSTVAFAFESLVADTQLAFSMQIRLSKDAKGKITNVGYVLGTDENGNPASVPSNPAVVTVFAPVPPTLTKTASSATSTAGGVVRYTLSLFTGRGWKGTDVVVDGQPRNLVVVLDTLPANTLFSSIVQAAGGQVLYQVYDAPVGSYQSTPPTSLDQVSAVAFGFESLPDNAQLAMSFDLRMSEAAGGKIGNVACIDATNPEGVRQSSLCDSADVTLPPRPPVLQYRDDPLERDVTVSGSGMPLNLVATAAACNVNPGVAERYTVFLHSRNADDDEGPLTITESGPNTGVFVLAGVPTALWPTAQQVSNDGVVQVSMNDIVDAVMECGGHRMIDEILIDPAGIVFDSSNGDPIAGATVTLMLVNADGSMQPARILGFDGKVLSSTVITGEDGLYQFPIVAPGNYRFVVVPPNGYRFPSQVPAAQQPPERIIGEGSFGEPFSTDENGNRIQDIPLDPMPISGLMLEKEGSRRAAEIGETLRYTLTLHNSSGMAVNEVRIEDLLPIGFAYLPGTARLNGAPIEDPSGAPGRNLVFPVGTVAVGAEVTLDYVVRLNAGALTGDGINVAQAHSPRADSNIARFAVEVLPGVFSNEAFILGKVFIDCNRNDLQGDEELGIPGVRMYLDNGNFVITDSEGKYSFYGVSPRTYTLKIDRITLPQGAEMATVSNRNAGDPHSRFVDLKNGELHRADFAEGSCTPELLTEVKRRRTAGEVANARIDDNDTNFTAPLSTESSTSRVDPRTRPASGVMGPDGRIVLESGNSEVAEMAMVAAPLAGTQPKRTVGAAPLSRTTTIDLEKVLPDLTDNNFGFMDLKDGDTLPSADVTVRIKGRDGAKFQLFVNGEAVADSRVGQKARMPTKQLQAWEYVAVKLKPGVNELRAEGRDGFNNLRDKAEIKLIAPDKLGQLRMILPPEGAVADGQTPAPILVRLMDSNGVLVTARTQLTLEVVGARWDVKDLEADSPGVQTFIEGGEALFDLIPPSEPGNADLRVTSSLIEDEARLPLNPFLRPLVASGIIEGAAGLNKIDAEALAPVSPEDGFERDIERINGGNGDASVGARGSMFLKGKVKGNYLLTLAYDSDKDTRDRLFRDIEPERFYPIYGDASIKGFEAQSTSPLYLRIDKGRSYLLYGDFNTSGEQQGQGQNQARQLSGYSRSLTGVQQHIESGRVVVNLFASHDSRRQQINEFRAEGVSGPYRLPSGGFLRNSEKVEIVTRDRNQPSVVLGAQLQTRFVDYTIDELSGTIMFTRPVSGLDAELNPVFVRITWEVDNGGKKFWVYGADSRYRLTESLEVGGSVVHEADPGAALTLYGANATLQVGQDSAVTVEAARSEQELGASGNAWRAEYNSRGAGVETRVFVARSDENFKNPSALVQPGSTEAGITGGLRLSERLRVTTQGLHSESAESGESRQGIFTGAEYALTQRLTLAVGLRYAHDKTEGGTEDDEDSSEDEAAREVTSVSTKVTWIPEFLPKASAFIEYEQDVENADNRMLGVGGNYQLSQRSRMYARHELISSPNGPFGLSEMSKEQNSTVFGVDYDYMDNANAFSEYRVRDALDGAEAQAAVGLRNGWTLKSGLRLSTQFERVQPIDGLASENTAVALGAQYTADPLTKIGTRMEWRQGESDTSLLNTVAVARKLNMDWSMLAKNTVSLTERDGSEGEGDSKLIRDRLRVGMAWRQTDKNEWSWLGLFESRYDRDDSDETRRFAQVLSSHVNYQPNRDWVLSGRYAMKYVNEDSYGVDSNYFGHLLSGRATYDITERWDAGVVASVLADSASAKYGLGVEIGYLITSNLWVSGGYNLHGYEDKDFEAVDYTSQGPYVRLRFKFDEEWLQWLE